MEKYFFFAFRPDMAYKLQPPGRCDPRPGAAFPYSRGAAIDHNPCLQCGACCAFYRASFYWGETDLATLGGVPEAMTVKINERFVAMNGTECHSPRCMALNGEIGVHVQCSIYARRASVCRAFVPSWENGIPNPRCDAARRKWSLPPLTPESWEGPRPLPESA